MKSKHLIYNARIHTQADFQIVNSMAINKNRIVAVGNNLQADTDFKSYEKIDLKGHCVTPGFIDAHTHFAYFALSFNRANLYNFDSLNKCLKEIKKFAAKLKPDEWVYGEGYSPDDFKKYVEPNRFDLDKVTGNRPAFVFSKDEHTAWVNSKALELAGIDENSDDPVGGTIDRLPDGRPSGLLREHAAYGRVIELIPNPPMKVMDRCYEKALDFAYRQGITGTHSVDSPWAYEFFNEKSDRGKLGLRIDYYMSHKMLPELLEKKAYFGSGNDFFRLAGIKIFADGSLGSQTALCFNKYVGSKGNYGVEALTVKQLEKNIKQAARLGLPCAIHAIGDKAVSNVLDAFETAPRLNFGARHRIEHLQQIRRKDIIRAKKLGVVASMQPSHCPSDIKIVNKYWGKYGANAYVFKSLAKAGVPLAFGSDCPIEPMIPLDGIAAAVRRSRRGKRDIFYPEQRISAAEALFHYTAGAAFAAGMEHSRGYLLPGYPADYVVLSDDITRIAPNKLYDVEVLATVLDSKPKYIQTGFSF